MTIANVSQGSARGLPPALRTAQAAIHLPEVQEMLRRLSEYKLGIFMPHMHDRQTGEFQPLPGRRHCVRKAERLIRPDPQNVFACDVSNPENRQLAK
jgi:hypothetical protein